MSSTRRQFLQQMAAASVCTTAGMAMADSRIARDADISSSEASSAETKQGNGLAFARARNLRHGINASQWFAQSQDYSLQRLQTYTTSADIALMAKMGFDHVRLSIDAAPLTGWLRSQNTTNVFIDQLDRVTGNIQQNGMAVIVDIHPESSYKATLRNGANGVEEFTGLWRSLASHFASSNPERVFMEMMNEPEQSDPYRWQGIQSTVAAAIRESAPHHTIIAAGAHWSGLSDLLALEPLGLGNVIYTFHDYEPFPFTHQGATWTDPRVRPLRGIPYPSSPEDIAPKLQEEPTLGSQFFLDQYGLDQWNAARVENTIAYAARWSKLNNAPVYCGEFGVFRKYAPPDMRAAWLRDMRVALEKYKIGWAMWDYQGGFNVVTKQNGVATPDNQVLEALGLKMHT